MIIQHEKSTCIKMGEIKETTFSLKTTAKAFRVLTGNLYSDKVSACIRELSANAKDSHIAAGRENSPFEVSLPSFIEPNFIIRDFGTGMSEEFMLANENGYTTAFYSTKSESNDYTGSMGLGRLSALSLSDSYICSSFQNKTKKTYSVYINENGIPSISLLTVEETDELDGFLVDIPVPQNYINQFDDKAKKTFSYYKVKPIIKNRENFVIPENKYIILSDDGSWGVAGSQTKSSAIMGCYNYPLDIYSVPDLTDQQTNLLNSGVVIHFNLGDLNISANRESLYYDKKTIANIKVRLNNIIQEIQPKILKDFVGKDGFEQSKFFNSLFNYGSALYNIAPLVKDVIKNNLKIKEYLDIDNEQFQVFKAYVDGRKDKVKFSEVYRVYPTENTYLFYGDKKTHFRLKLKKYLEDSARINQSVFILFPKNAAALDYLKKEHDIDLVQYPAVSPLPFDPVIKNSQGSSKVKSLLFIGKNSGWRVKQSDYWTEAEFDENGEYFYVERNGYIFNRTTETSDKDNNQDDDLNFSEPAELDSIKTFLKLTGQEKPIIGLTKNQLKNKSENWINLMEFIQDQRKDFFDDEKTKNYKACEYFRLNYSGYYDDINEEWLELKAPKDSLFAKIIEEYNYLKDINDKNKEIFDAAFCIRISPPKFNKKKYNYSTTRLKKYYPLINTKEDYSKSVIKDLNEYIARKSESLDLELTKLAESEKLNPDLEN